MTLRKFAVLLAVFALFLAAGVLYQVKTFDVAMPIRGEQP